MKKILLLLSLFYALQSNAQCWEQVSSGYLHSLALKTDGTLWSWGFNQFGELGNGTLNDFEAVPYQVGTDSKWIMISTKNQTCMALRTDGTLWGWGYNPDGEVGDGTTTNRTEPTQIGTDTNWKAVSCGALHTIALKTDGTLWAWGNNEVGQIGSSGLDFSNIPVQVGTANDWQSISAGSWHSLAIKTNGTLWSWGNPGGTENYGMLQIGNDTDWQTPIGGYFSSAALKTNGTLYTWGINQLGELGLGFESDVVSVPTLVSTDTWANVAIDWHDMRGLKADGTLWGWGQNIVGEAGPDVTGPQSLPVYMPAGNDWHMVEAGQWFVTAIKNDGSLWGWGRNDFHQLGNNTPWDETTTTPVLISESSGTCNFLALGQIVKNTVMVYPNPAQDIVHILSPDVIKQTEVTDVAGKVIFSQMEGDYINVQQLPSGIYFLKIETNAGVQVQKIIRQ